MMSCDNVTVMNIYHADDDPISQYKYIVYIQYLLTQGEPLFNRNYYVDMFTMYGLKCKYKPFIYFLSVYIQAF